MTERLKLDQEDHQVDVQDDHVARHTSINSVRIPTNQHQGRTHVAARMIGRAAELQQMLTMLYQVLANDMTRGVTISGEPGIGKTRLLLEFERCITSMPDYMHLVHVAAQQQLSMQPYALLRDLFSTLFAIHDDDPIAVARHKFEQGVITWMGSDSLDQAHFIGHLLGFDFSNSPYLRGVQADAQQIRDRAIIYAMRLIGTITAHSPAIIMLEDIHWADTSSLDFLECLTRECSDRAIFIVCMTRMDLFERRPAWGVGLPAHTRLQMYPLSDDESRQLITEILGKDIPASVRELVISRAAGNPFYIEELIAMLIDDGLLVKEAGQWQFRLYDLNRLRIPSTLTAVLQARENLLRPIEQRVLRYAAVVGQTFWASAVEAADNDLGDTQPPFDLFIDQQPLTAEMTHHILYTLQQKELIFAQEVPTVAGEPAYAFRHALLRDVVYERTPTQMRQRYHTRVAAWLIRQSSERVGQHAGIIAEHYERADDAEMAAVWYEQAAQQAGAAYAPIEAIAYYERALALLPQENLYAPQRIAIYKALGKIFGQQTRFADAIMIYVDLRTIAENLGGLATQAHAWHNLAWIYTNQGDLHAALEHSERAIALARAGQAPRELVMALFRKGMVLYHQGDVYAALAVGEEALKLSTELNAKMEMAWSLNLLGVAHEVLGHWDQVFAYKRRALAIHQELGDLHGVGVMLNNLATVAERQGDLQTALELFQQTQEIVCEIGDKEGEIFALCNLGWTKLRLGDCAAAEVDVRQSIERAEAVGLGILPGLYAYLTEALLGQGNIHDAILTAHHSLDLALQSDRRSDAGNAWRVLGMTLSCLPEPEGAPACFAEAVRIFSELEAEIDRVCVLREWARYEVRHGDAARGYTMWQEVRATFTRLNMEAELAHMSEVPT